jgi:AcrR family transcriptional regulator
MTGPVKRKYHSPRRTAAAATTRARIRQAASELFVAQGFVATTMREIAAHAGVGERTLYDAFPSKAALFGHTLGVAIVGDEQPVPVAERPEVLAARDAPDPTVAIRDMVRYSAALLERAGDLIMVSVEAAGSDPDMRAAADAGASETHRVCLAFTHALHRRSALRQHLEPTAAADIMYAMLSPHLHQLLRRHRKWSAARYLRWLERVLVAELLRDPTGPREAAAR